MFHFFIVKFEFSWYVIFNPNIYIDLKTYQLSEGVILCIAIHVSHNWYFILTILNIFFKDIQEVILGESDSSSIQRLPPLNSTKITGPRPRYLILALKYEKIKKNTIYLQIKAGSSHWNRNRKQISMCLKAQCLCNFTLLSFWKYRVFKLSEGGP